jgi:hypothetical protein
MYLPYYFFGGKDKGCSTASKGRWGNLVLLVSKAGCGSKKKSSIPA